MTTHLLVCPFIKKAQLTCLYSWIFSLPSGTIIKTDRKVLKDLSIAFAVHPSTIKRQLHSLQSSKYFSFEKGREGGTIKRTVLNSNHCTVSLSHSIIKQHRLSSSEIVILTALYFYQSRKKRIPARKVIAGRTGFSLRQVSYALKTLKQKGLASSFYQKEPYTRHSKGDVIQDIRHRKTYSISNDLFQLCKIAPLKDNYRYPVIKNNGFLISKSYINKNNQDKKSDLNKIWNIYKKKFNPHSFESFFGTKKYLKSFGINRLNTEQATQVLEIFSKNQFLKLAHTFGWQEAVTELYQRKGLLIGTTSSHLQKYGDHKPGLGWILKNAAKILKGIYDFKETSKKQKQWENNYQPAGNKNPIGEKGREALLPSAEEISAEITRKFEGNPDAKKGHLSILKKVGNILYHTWIKACQVTLDEGVIKIKSPSSFHRDMIDVKIILPYGLNQLIKVI